MARHTSRRRSRRKPNRIAALIGSILFLCTAVVFVLTQYGDELKAVLSPSAVSTSVSGEDLQVHIIDVGNADAILAVKDGQSLLIDAGENSTADRVIAYLRSHNIERLDYVIATHPDSDHIGGMDDVVNAFPIGTFLMSFMPEEQTPTTKTYLRLLQALDDRGLEITEAKPGQAYALGSARLTILGPVGEYEDTNNMSVVCRLDYGERGFLFMGDAEKEAEEALLASGQPLKADFLKLGHHGSKSSSSEELIAAVRPAYAAITCGVDNSYGHPHAETLERMEQYGVTVYRCDINGTIDLTCDGETINIKTEK